MTREELYNIVQDVSKRVDSQIALELRNVMLESANKNVKITPEEIGVIVFGKATQYSNQMLLNVLCEVLEVED